MARNWGANNSPLNLEDGKLKILLEELNLNFGVNEKPLKKTGKVAGLQGEGEGFVLNEF